MVTGAESILLILDEASILESSFRDMLERQPLTRFINALKQAKIREEIRAEWIYKSTLLTEANTKELQQSDWKLPNLTIQEVIAIQEAGFTTDQNFQWLGYQLQAFGQSPLAKRWSDDHGIYYVIHPYLANKTLILSANMEPKYAERQLGVEYVHNPAPPTIIHHKDTRVYNLCCLHGVSRRFPGNKAQILDIIGQLILRNIASGRRTLLISRKHLKQTCIDYLSARLSQWGQKVEFEACSGKPNHEPDPNIIPVIHYGISGINSFEEYDAAYCINSYYLDEAVLREAIMDVDSGEDQEFPVHIKLQGNPKRRVAGTFDRDYQASNADQICQTYFHQLETNVVIQAVGRVRYATKPREVLTFQASHIPGVPLAEEFTTLRECRQHFNLKTGSEYTRHYHSQEAKRLRKIGLTTKEIAKRLEISERTVRYRLAES